MHTFKFGRAQAAAQTIGALMADALPYLSKSTFLIPVPPATSRLRIRGYDHTLLLAQAVSRHSGLHYLTVVGRIGQSRQVGAKRQMRLQQLNQAFFIKRPAVVKGAEVLLDDIVTTGGTLESVAKVLKQAGAKSVNALVFAQKT